MASRVRSAREDLCRFRNCRRNLRTWRSRERGGARTGGCLWKTERQTSMGGMVVKRRLFVGIVLLLLQNTLAFSDDSSNYEASGSTVLSVDQATLATSPHQLAGLLMTDEDPASVIQSQPTSLSKDIREEPAFSSILSALASTAAKPQSPFHSFSILESETNHSHSEGPIQRAKWSFRSPSSSAAEHVSNQSSSAAERVSNQSAASEEPPLDEWVSELVSSVVASRETGLHSKGNDSHVSASKRRITSLPSKKINASTEIELAGHELVASSVPQLTTVTTTTVVTATTTTTAPSPVTTTTQLTSTTRLNSSRPSSATSATSTATFKAVRIKVPALIPPWAVVTQAARATPPRGLAGAHPTTTTTTTISSTTSTTSTTTRAPLSCNVTDRMWVKTVLSVHPRRYRLDSILKQNLLRGLTLVTGKALNIRDVQVQIESLSVAANVTVGYYVAHGDQVFTASVVAEALNAYSQDRLVADIRQFVPHVQAAPVPAAPWRPRPAASLMLKTVLRFVGPGDDVRFCAFTQMMEQSLQNAFTEAEVKALSSRSKLTVQMLTVTQSTGSPAVSLIYVVYNGSVALNGTEASTLLSRLTAELVGYFLFYPPLITAEPLEYHNLNTSAATKNFWVITVIQDVENTSLESQYQSFASLMEQRLAELFLVAHQQGSRFRRATAAGSYTVQMVGMRRLAGPKNPVELTYYVEHDGTPLPGTSAAKILNTVDSQTMALTLGYFVQVQAEPVVKNPSNNLWIIAAVLAPIGVVTIIIIIITAVLCRKNKSDFKTDAIGHLNPRVKTAYRRDVGYYHQPVQGFDYAKQHLGQQSGDEETLPVKQEPLVLSLPVRDTSLSLDKVIHPDGTNSKKTLTGDVRKRLPSEEGSVISSESAKGISSRGSAAQKVTAQQKLAKEESGKRGVDPYDTSSGSLQLISIKPMVAPPTYSHPASSDRSQDSANLSGEVSLALKQKSDIEHYRNKLRLKAKRKGYYDFPSAEGGGSSKALSERSRHGQDRAARPPAAAPHTPGRAPDDYDDRSSTYVKSHRRHSQVTSPAYRSRQSLNSPSPGGTEMDLLVMRERPRKGIRNSGYDTEPELIEETDVDRLAARRHYGYGRQVKGHSETSTLSSQPSIDEVRQQMHLLLEEAFSLASAGHSSSGRRHQYHPYHQHQQLGAFSPGPPLPYSEVVTSAPGTMIRGRGGLQWMPAYGQDLYQCSLTKPTFRFTQLPEMVLGSPPPIPPRTGPPPGSSLRRSSSDLGPKVRSSESSVQDMQSQHESNPYVPVSRAPPPASTSESAPNHSGNPMTAVYAIPAGRPGYTGYFISTPPSSYHSPSWMSYPPEPEDVPSQWADSVPLPGYAEAFPHPHYPQGSPLLWKHSQAITPQGHLEQPPSTATSQQSLAEPRDLISPDTPLSSLSTSALVKAIRDEVAKLAKKQADMFEFQV